MLPNVAGAVYGTIAVGTLLAAEGTRKETYGQTIAAVVLTLVLYWLAHAYAELTGRRLEHRVTLTFGELRRVLLHELPLLAGAAAPLLTILLFWVAGGGLDHALQAGVWTAAAMLVIIEFVAARRDHLSRAETSAQTLLGAALGLLVIALRAVLH